MSLFSESESFLLQELIKYAPYSADEEEVFLDALEATGHFARACPNPKVFYGITTVPLYIIWHEDFSKTWNGQYNGGRNIHSGNSIIPEGTICAEIGSKGFNCLYGDDLTTIKFDIMVIDGRIAYYNTCTHYACGIKYISMPCKALKSKNKVWKFFSYADNIIFKTQEHISHSSNFGNCYNIIVSIESPILEKIQAMGCTEDEAWDRLYSQINQIWTEKLINKNLIQIGC